MGEGVQESIVCVCVCVCVCLGLLWLTCLSVAVCLSVVVCLSVAVCLSVTVCLSPCPLAFPPLFICLLLSLFLSLSLSLPPFLSLSLSPSSSFSPSPSFYIPVSILFLSHSLPSALFLLFLSPPLCSLLAYALLLSRSLPRLSRTEPRARHRSRRVRFCVMCHMML